MWYVLGCIVTNVLLLLWLRVLRLPLISLITLNYFVCVGMISYIDAPSLYAFQRLPAGGKILLLTLGILFITVFALTGRATKEIGVGLSGMLAKLSLILPISYAALILGEPISHTQGIGILLGLFSIVIVHLPYLQEGRKSLKNFQIGIWLWLGNGIIDILFKEGARTWQGLSTLHIPFFIMLVAGVIGIIFHIVKDKLRDFFSLRAAAGAFLLGSTNLLSIFFYLKGLNILPAAQFFMWNNLGIVLISGVVGIAFFRERFRWEVGLGYGIGGLSLLLLSL
ncbi:MAG: hypothetical protein RMJ66_01250 [Bacteroidia bacterium]|nr:hypothetical protein [Bacteroidia bacterium]MDW8133670.1 hypothetical protein [Bacteroidia bacterium]